ncbi:unnamed protein product [Chrysodeixis includens]|uniref:Rad21/Rec8-like protein N-terminal domain-containing protein n=1 Tax=Chrysodeixis includens TaxID=689277 RepID=A0A9P0BMB8_CHRIL|nr:unnamed protein product [Chrysodeixis includens]
MFYPVESLKRGGRFYLCWVADSWPLRFAHITHRQLWSQDIRKICEDLLEVVRNESGRPAKRFSLRLSSQLLRGVARLHYAKASNLLEELCMINATVIKQTNKKWHIHKVDVVQRVRQPPQVQQLEIQELPEEQRLEELIQRSGNIVSNIEDITLKEATITDVLLPPNDGFGEENPEQALQVLADRTLEMMLVQHDVASLHSGLAAALDLTALDKSDKSRVGHDLQMERLEEHDVTLFRKSTGEELIAEFEKDIPEIPEIPPPELPVPQPEKPFEVPAPAPSTHVAVAETSKPQEPQVDIELEELEEVAPQVKRRKFGNKLIIDKKIKISTNHFRARIENPLVELRCEDSSDDIIFIQVPPDSYFRRPCHGGGKIASNVGFDITRMFRRNLGVVSALTRIDREMELPREAVMQKTNRTFTRSMLERIDEEQEAPVAQDRLEVQLEQPRVSETNLSTELQNIFQPERESAENQEMNIADMLTQKVETLSQSRKRTALQETLGSPKRQCSIGYVSFRESQIAKEKAHFITDVDGDKENVPDNIMPQPQDAEIMLSSKLQEAGLADIVPQPLMFEVPLTQTQRPTIASNRKSQRTGSDSSETPLGSLDRTKVSLGDSEQTTDSKRFIRDQWGTEGTMIKILKHIKARLQPVTVRSLIAKGPVISGYKCIIAARCFTSILKLKKHGFINITKDPETLEIVDVSLGPQLNSSE